MENCIFCKIAAGEIPSNKVFENDAILAFKDINPAAPTHLLIIPKKHIATLSDCTANDAELLGKMLALAPQLAHEQSCHVQTDANGERSGGFKTLINSGPDGGQEVYHLHIHVIGGKRPCRGI